jgi:uncharacterized protein (DUF169 family)
MDFKKQGARLQQLLALRHPSVAVAFRAAAPPGIRRVDHAAPSGCSYWRLAAEGRVFFTEASDHYHCPIGAHTHGIHLPAETAQELEGLIGTMAQLRYIRMEEVANIPQRHQPFGVAIYAPLTAAPVEPDAVLVRGNPKQMMLLVEAAHAVGIAADVAARLRPTCAIVPEAAEAGQASLSLGCIGNRVYTGLADDECYFAIPGGQLSAVLDRLETITTANRTLEEYHRRRQAEGTSRR